MRKVERKVRASDANLNPYPSLSALEKQKLA